MGDRARGIEIISTCPPSNDVQRGDYGRRIAEVARWSERHGCTGTLVYTDNRLADPWLVAQLVVQATDRLCPLVAVQPVYMHPYTVAKMVASIGHLHGRRVDLNLVAGGFKNDLDALGDTTPHDARYDRLIEYGQIIRDLLTGEQVRRDGVFYRVHNLKLSPPEPAGLSPWLFVSGSSEAGLGAATTLGAKAVMYPLPPGEERAAPAGPAPAGVRVGVVARETDADAWRAARARFPGDRKGQIAHELAMRSSDSSWHRQLSELALVESAEPSPYWLFPFQNYKTFCPYLVGSYATVARLLERYIELGYRTFIVDIPESEEDLGHAGVAFRMAQRGLPC
jgi:alkanesulfonate monooxygenase